VPATRGDVTVPQQQRCDPPSVPGRRASPTLFEPSRPGAPRSPGMTPVTPQRPGRDVFAGISAVVDALVAPRSPTPHRFRVGPSFNREGPPARPCACARLRRAGEHTATRRPVVRARRDSMGFKRPPRQTETLRGERGHRSGPVWPWPPPWDPLGLPVPQQDQLSPCTPSSQLAASGEAPAYSSRRRRKQVLNRRLDLDPPRHPLARCDVHRLLRQGRPPHRSWRSSGCSAGGSPGAEPFPHRVVARAEGRSRNVTFKVRETVTLIVRFPEILLLPPRRG